MTVSSNAAAMVNLTRAELLGRFFITDSDSTWDSELRGLGERIESRSLPFIGVYRGEYDHRRVVLFDLRFNWRFGRNR